MPIRWSTPPRLSTHALSMGCLMECPAPLLAFHYKDVYDILEKAHKEGKKVVLKMPNLEPVSSSTNGIIVSVPPVDITDIMENEDDWDSSLVLATE